MTRTLFIKTITRTLFIAVILTGCTPVWHIDNPYNEVDWAEHSRYKANFHTHTTMSDGTLNPDMVVDHYHALGYEILAITDHNNVTYPWTDFSGMEASNRSKERLIADPERMPATLDYEDRDTEELGMIAIQGNELSSHHHMGSFFNDHNGTTSVEESLKATKAKGGIAMLYHPGRYSGEYRRPGTDHVPIEWYVDLYERYDHLIGLEVYNLGDRYPHDRFIWDSILTVTMPGRPVWGFSNDDMHNLPNMGRNWNIMILPELTVEWVRSGMENGLSYFIHAPAGHDGSEPPVIESIHVDNRRGIINIYATGYDSVAWISGGNVVHEGSRLNLNDLEDHDLSYIRVKLFGQGETVAGTQPFGIRKQK